MVWRRMPRSVRLFLIALLYAAVLAGHIGIVHFYVNHLSDKVDSRPIVVTRHEIPMHSVITEGDLEVKRIRLSDAVSGAYRDLEEVVGKESTSPLAGNEQITPQKINAVIKREGEMIVEIPGDWLLSFPKSLRRLDRIRFLPVFTPGPRTAETGAAPPPSFNTGHSIRSQSVTVAYFKDNAANEIADPGSDQAAPRLHSTNVGARLEVVLTPEQFDQLEDLARRQYRFVVSYE